MAVEIIKHQPSVIELDIKDKIHKEDYKRFNPLAEDCIDSHGSMNLLVKISKFEGWTPSALWEDLKFDVKHYDDISRFALVGEDESKEWLASLSKRFTNAEVKYYPESQYDLAKSWVMEN